MRLVSVLHSSALAEAMSRQSTIKQRSLKTLERETTMPAQKTDMRIELALLLALGRVLHVHQDRRGNDPAGDADRRPHLDGRRDPSWLHQVTRVPARKPALAG